MVLQLSELWGFAQIKQGSFPYSRPQLENLEYADCSCLKKVLQFGNSLAGFALTHPGKHSFIEDMGDSFSF